VELGGEFGHENHEKARGVMASDEQIIEQKGTETTEKERGRMLRELRQLSVLQG